MAHLVEGMHQRAGARLDDIGRGPVPGQRLAVDPCLDEDLSQAVSSGRDRLDGQIQDVDLALHHLRDRRERGGNGPVAGRRSAAVPGPGSCEPHVGACGDGPTRDLQVREPVGLRRIVESPV